MHRRTLVTAASGALVLSALTGVPGAAGTSTSSGSSGVPTTVATPPNIVLVLADDLDAALVAQMRSVRRLKRSGVTFDGSFVVDSLCCPSRAATFTGMFPHNTGVRANTSPADDPNPIGGYPAFQAVQDKSFPVTLQQQGYSTGFMGKYMNEYPARDGAPLPPGWDVWNAVSAGGYRGWQYAMTSLATNATGKQVVQATSYDGLGDHDYVQTQLARRAVDFIDTAETDTAPYFLEIAPYATHSRVNGRAHPNDPLFPPALVDRPSASDPDGNCGGGRWAAAADCRRLAVGSLPGLGQRTSDNRPYSVDGAHRYRGWLPSAPLSTAELHSLTRDYRDRARMAQSVDRIVRAVVAASSGEPTYVVFTSDNGYRLGQFSLGHGKGTAYTPDISVPLVVGGSAVPATMQGVHRSEIVENTDLAPTFEDIAGVSRFPDYEDGTSLLPLLRSPQPRPWRRLAYVEHVKPPAALDNPDQEASTARVPTYWAVRSADALLVKSWQQVGTKAGQPVWDDVYEYYTGLSRRGGYEAVNTYSPRNRTVQRMLSALDSYETCSGSSCREVSVS